MTYAGLRDLTARPSLLMMALTLSMATVSVKAGELDRLNSLLAATPQGGWVKANVGLYSDAWAVGSTAVNVNSYKNPATVETAWSSFAWNDTTGDLMLWGGGHANYAGNEMYVWDGSSGNWSRGSLSSRLTSTFDVVDNAAPQSSHTYDNNIFLQNNNMFLTFGGAAYTSGGNTTYNGVRTGPWLWDPTKADPNKVGGTTGSGYDVTSLGGQMWTNLASSSTGVVPPGFVNSTAAYRSENGKDVVYVTSDNNASGFPVLYRYTLGDMRNGGTATWEAIGRMWNSYGYAGTGTLDTANNYYVRTVAAGNSKDYDLTLWKLSAATPGNPDANLDIPISLKYADGTSFAVNSSMAIEFDSDDNEYVIWDGKNMGTVYYTRATFDATGKLQTTWTVTKSASTTSSQPSGNFLNGVLGKWHYSDSLDAFVALNEYSSGDAQVWLYKPLDAVDVVPEPSTLMLYLAGFSGLLLMARRRIRPN